MKKTLLFLIFCLTLLAAEARPVSYYSAKRMGMGGTGAAVVNKEDSYFYNPAHAAIIKQSFHMPPFLLFPNSIYYGTETPDTLNKLSDIEDDDESIVATYRRVIPSQVGFGGSWSSGLVFTLEDIGSFAIGTYAGGRFDAKIVNRLSPRFEGSGYFDAILPSLTFAQNVDIESAHETWHWLRNPSIGITFKHVNRFSLYDPEEGSETVSIEVLDLDDNRVAFRAGKGYGFDIGGQAEIDTFMGLVTAAVVFNNIATNIHGIEYEPELKVTDNEDTTFSESAYSQQIPFSMTVGVAKQASPFAGLRNMRGIGWAWAALDTVFPNAVYAADIELFLPAPRGAADSLFKKLHFGLEQTYSVFNLFDLDWRLGLNQGYPTTGLNFNFGFWHMGLTYYTEELGKEVGEMPASYYVLHSSFVF